MRENAISGKEDCWSLWEEKENEEGYEWNERQWRGCHEHRSDHQKVGEFRGWSAKERLHQAVLADLGHLSLAIVWRLRCRVVLRSLSLSLVVVVLGAHLVVELGGHELRKHTLLLIRRRWDDTRVRGREVGVER